MGSVNNLRALWSFPPEVLPLSNRPSLPPLLHRDDSAEVDVYNPTKDEWDKIPSMNQVNLQVQCL